MIQLQIIGRVGKDAEVKEFSGKTVINFSVAHSEKRKDGDVTTWVNCSYWTDKTGVAAYIKKGGLVYVTGTPSVRAHEGKAYLELNVSKVELLGGNKLEEKNVTAAPETVTETVTETDDLPW